MTTERLHVCDLNHDHLDHYITITTDQWRIAGFLVFADHYTGHGIYSDDFTTPAPTDAESFIQVGPFVGDVPGNTPCTVSRED